MNPLLQMLVGAAVRWVITVAATKEVIVSEDDATKIVSGLVALGMLFWSFYQKHRADERIDIARTTGL